MKQRLVTACAVLLIASGCARHANQERPKGAATKEVAARLSQPVRLSAEDRDAAEPAMATSRDGSVNLAWVEHRGGGEADVLFARLDREGGASGTPPLRVNPKAGEATAWRGDPPTVAIGGDGTIYVGWTARGMGEGQTSDLYLSASRDHGQTFDPPVKVNDDRTPAVHGMHSLAVSSDNRIYVAWLDERNINRPQPSEQAGGHHMESNREVFMTVSTDGGRTFAPNLRVASDACPCCKTALAVAPEGRLYLSWRQVLPGDYRHIAVSSSEDGGKTFQPPVIVSDDRWMLKGCPVSGAALSVGADGALHVLWYAAGEKGVPGFYWSESRDGGRSFAPRRLFASAQARGTPRLLRGSASDMMAVWEITENGSSHITLARLTGDEGTAASTTVADNAELPSAATSGDNLYIAYIARAGGQQQRGVWIVTAKSI
jgi:hypothetical protein